MKVKLILMALLGALVFSACKNEGEAYKNAMSSSDVEVLSQYLTEFPDAPAEHLDSVKSKLENEKYNKTISSNDIEILSQFLADFPDAPTEHYDRVQAKMEDLGAQEESYSIITTSADIVEKFTQAETYMKLYPNGIYAKEVQEFINKEGEAYKTELENRKKEKYDALYGELVRESIEGYKYIGDVHTLFFTVPDFNGKGYVCSKYASYRIAPYQISSNGEMTISKGKSVEFSINTDLVKYYNSLGLGIESIKKDGYKKVNNNYWYKDATFDGIEYAKIDYFGRTYANYMSSRGRELYEKALCSEDEYNKVMELIKACLPTYQKY